MRISHLILIVASIVACCLCWRLGYRVGKKESPLQEARRGDLLVALRTYQAGEGTNWIKVQSTIGMQVLALTRDYERLFGAPTGTNRFVQQFAEALIVAAKVERQLVPINAAFTNLPLAPDLKVRTRKEP